MKTKIPFIALLGLWSAACDDTTNDIGIFTEEDNISASTAIYEARTRSLVADSVLSNSNNSYLGRMTDPETGLQVKAEFLAQFATLENWEFPDYGLMVKNAEGEVEADSIEIRLYYERYYGDGNNPMKVEVYELDTTNVIREDSTYYSNADLTRYINSKANGPVTSKIFTATDFTLSEDDREESSYSPNIRIVLPKDYGTFILRKYYENQDFFRNSYNFIHHVCPGFYFKLTDGNGTMVKMRVGAMNLYFKYRDAERDTVYVGMGRFAATPEVLQNTYVENEGLDAWIDNNTECTYLKTPAGVFTEMTLPVDEIYEGHENDSISQTQFTLYRYNTEADQAEAFGIPQTLLMVRKQDMYAFFEERRVPDNRTSFVTSFNNSYNTYTFSNISNLIAYCRREKNSESAKAGLTPEAWAQSHEDWNKVVLIPVETNEDNSNNIVSVTHDMGIGSTRLVGGTNDRISLQVIYSTFQ